MQVALVVKVTNVTRSHQPVGTNCFGRLLGVLPVAHHPARSGHADLPDTLAVGRRLSGERLRGVFDKDGRRFRRFPSTCHSAEFDTVLRCGVVHVWFERRDREDFGLAVALREHRVWELAHRLLDEAWWEARTPVNDCFHRREGAVGKHLQKLIHCGTKEHVASDVVLINEMGPVPRIGRCTTSSHHRVNTLHRHSHRQRASTHTTKRAPRQPGV
mmetsp:Transcript_31183/g.81783  ORF Transcript_31183/g.81783 Transcript_31183/m.81783 type:complete len:215 (-) Transcript_31183:914-1558(-)